MSRPPPTDTANGAATGSPNGGALDPGNVNGATARASVAAMWAGRILPPSLLYLLVRLAYSRAAGVAVGDMEPSAWARWDSGNYADIAQNGYYWASCASQNRAVHGDICSPAAWYPAYPYLARWLADLTDISLDHAFVFIAHAAFLALLYAVWLGFFRGRLSGRHLMLLVLAAFFPGAIYFLASFPMSLLVLGLCLQITCFVRGRWWLGAVFGALASMCYPIAVVLPLTSTIWVVLASRADGTWASDRRASLTRAAGVGGIVASGTLAVLALHQAVLGDWAASLHEQEKFGGTLYNPVFNWLHTVVKQNSWIQATYPETARVIAAQTLLVTVIIAVVVGVVVFVRSGRTAHDVGLLVMVLGLWLVPLSSNIETGLYRRVAPLLPAVYLLRRAPWPVTAALTLASIGVWWWMAPKFASGSLI